MNDQDKNREQIIEELVELRRQVTELQECRNRLQAIPLGIHESDTAGRITYVNAAQERITGYSADELVGTYIWDRVEPICQKEPLTAYLEHLVAEQPPPTPFVGKNVRKNGEIFDIRVDWNYKRNPQGQVIGFVSVVSDITEQKRAEEALRESEARSRLFSDVIEYSSQHFGVGYADGRLGIVNRAFCDLVGYSQEELQSLDWSRDLTPPDWHAIEAEHLEHLLRTHTPVRYEKEYVCRDGSRIPVEVFVHLACDEAGSPHHFYSFVTDLTERKKAEEALQKAYDELEQRVHERTQELARANADLAIFRKFADASSQGFGMADLSGQITYANPAMLRLLGEQYMEDIVGRKFVDYAPDEYRQLVNESIMPTLLREGQWSGETPVVTRQGTVVVVQNAMFVILNETGEPFCIANIATDSTERKRAEEAVRASEENLRSFFNTTEDLLFVVALDGTIIWANQTALRRLDYREEELIGRSVSSVHPQDRSQEVEQIRAAIVAGIAKSFTLPLVTKHGRVIPAETLGVKGRWDGRDVLFGVSKDLSELRASEERFAKAFHSNPSPMALSTSDNRFIEVNEALIDTLGYERSEIIGMTASDLALFPDLERQMSAIVALYQEGRLREFPLDVRTKDGRVRHGLFSGEIIQLQDQQVMLTVMEDITERKVAEEALRKEHRTLKHLLQSSDHERQMIAYEIHDDLAQQLAGAIMQFQTFDHLKDKQPKQAADAYHAAFTMLQQGHAETRRLIASVRHPILDEEGVVEAVAHLVHEQSREKGPKIAHYSRVDFDRLVPVLENAIYRICQEALANACKHSGSEVVRVSLLQIGDRVRIEVQDWGGGFDPKTVHENRFGLEGIRQRARLLGGKCSIRSKLGKGTRILVELPVVEREEE